MMEAITTNLQHDVAVDVARDDKIETTELDLNVFSRICISCGPSIKGSYYCSKCKDMFEKLARDIRNEDL